MASHVSAEEQQARLVEERSKRQKTGPLGEIPAISLAPFLSGTEEEKAAVARKWDEACREVGFLKVSALPGGGQ